MAMHVMSVEQYLKGFDTRQMPRYSFGEAGRYLGLPESTIRSWFIGTTYGSQPHLRYFKPILTPAAPDLLSFFDIASAHILMALKKNGTSTEDIRGIVRSLEAEYPDERYPLLGRNFFQFGKQIVIKQAGARLSLPRGRQLGFKAVMDMFLKRIDLDANKMPVRFSPLRVYRPQKKSFIVIDPNLSAGRPVIKGTGIAVEVISKRNASGESVGSLAKDYGVSRRAIEEAIEYWTARAA